MKYIWKYLCVVLLLAGTIRAETMRTWESADGKSIVYASVVEVNGDTVVLRKMSGSKVSVPISKLREMDQEYLREHAQVEESAAPDQPVSADGLNLGYEQGRVVGPIEAGSEAHYLLYIPNSLQAGRKVPLLFFTHSGGGSNYLLDRIVEGAEINGWIMAISIESRNGRGVPKNIDSSERAVEQIIDQLPVDEDRLYFTGNSGGAAMAFYNYDNLDGYGIMPNIGYIPSGVAVPNGDAFIINGTYDYNRYTSASARKSIGKTAIHRFFPGGHQDAPGWIMVEGMVWLEGRFLAENGKKNMEEQLDYENSVIAWIGRLRDKEPYKAYYWAQFLKNELALSAQNTARVDALVKELGSSLNNRLYVEALEEIDEFSMKELTSFGTGSLHDHTDLHIISECEDLLEKYKGIPVIAELLKTFCQKTSPL